MKKAQKGSFQYLTEKRKTEAIKTVILFAIPLAIFVTGILSAGTTANLLTVVAVVGCLPASRSAVSMIMYLRVKGCSGEAYEAIEGTGAGEGYYHLYFTTYHKNFDISHLVISGNSILAYSEDERIAESEFASHIREMLRQNGYPEIHVKLWKNREQYLQRLAQLATSRCGAIQQETETEEKKQAEKMRNREAAIRSVLFAISL